MCQSCSSYNACRWPVAFGRGRGSRAQKLPAQSSRASFRSASRCPTPPGRGIGVRRYLCDSLGVAFASAPSASSAGFLQTGLSVAIVVADGADRADGVLDISRPRLNLISVLNTDWKRRRRPPPSARGPCGQQGLSRKSHGAAMDGTQRGRRSAREQELRWARPSRTQAARRRGGLSPRAAGLETGDSWQITIPRRSEQSSHSSLTSLKIGGFAGHILGHDAPPFSYSLLGPLAGVDRERLHQLRLDLAGLARFSAKVLPRSSSRTEVN